MQDPRCFPEIPTKYILTYFFIKNGPHLFTTQKSFFTIFIENIYKKFFYVILIMYKFPILKGLV